MNDLEELIKELAEIAALEDSAVRIDMDALINDLKDYLIEEGLSNAYND